MNEDDECRWNLILLTGEWKWWITSGDFSVLKRPETREAMMAIQSSGKPAKWYTETNMDKHVWTCDNITCKHLAKQNHWHQSLCVLSNVHVIFIFSAGQRLLTVALNRSTSKTFSQTHLLDPESASCSLSCFFSMPIFRGYSSSHQKKYPFQYSNIQYP